MLKSFATTVQTPQKCPGRDLPSSALDSEVSSTNVDRSSKYISAGGGRNRRLTPASRKSFRRRFPGADIVRNHFPVRTGADSRKCSTPLRHRSQHAHALSESTANAPCARPPSLERAREVCF